MITQKTYHRLLLLLALAWLIVAVSAARNKHGGDHDSANDAVDDAADYDGTPKTNPNPNAYPDSSNPSESNSNFGPPGGVMWAGSTYYRPYSQHGDHNNDDDDEGYMRTALNYRRVHGIMAAVAMVVLFPIGAILVRVLPAGRPRLAVWVHSGFQTLALCVLVGAAGVGVKLARMMVTPGGDLFALPSTRYHLIVGLAVLGLLLLQPLFGILHHSKYKKFQKRTMWSYLHLFNGRIAITAGIINGGLGLYIAHEAKKWIGVYAAVGGFMWAFWMSIAIWAEARRRQRNAKVEEEAAVKGGVKATGGYKPVTQKGEYR